MRLALVLLAAFAANAQPAKEWDVREVEGFVDGLIAAQMNAHHFAGSVVVIVRDMQVAFEKGYGYADFAARQPVDPKHTLNLWSKASSTCTRASTDSGPADQ